GPVAVTFPSRPSVPLCRINTEAQTRIAAEGAQIVARHARPPTIRERAEARVEHALSGADRYGQRLCALAQSRDLGRGRIAGADVGVGQRSAALSRQQRLGPAAAGEFRRRCGWLYTRTVCRSGLPEADGDRGSASGDPERSRLAAAPALVVPLP